MIVIVAASLGSGTGGTENTPTDYAPQANPTLESCWKDVPGQPDQVENVSCDDPNAQYVSIGKGSADGTCPSADALFSVKLDIGWVCVGNQ
ncbi:hypothetical protein [Cellulomonas humilata]|uniref:hypothetical protein n=1 Tax=Cellulomonas humilata TaxID=144055 RepID=UPI0027D80C0B|nr:hypothetical protein [Cellulomonas humilata]